MIEFTRKLVLTLILLAILIGAGVGLIGAGLALMHGWNFIALALGAPETNLFTATLVAGILIIFYWGFLD